MGLTYRQELAIIAFAAMWFLLVVALRYGWF